MNSNDQAQCNCGANHGEGHPITCPESPANHPNASNEKLGGGDVGCERHNVTNCEMCATENQRRPLPAGERIGADRPVTEALTSNQQWLPCPFCGHRDVRSHHRGHPSSGEWVIECHGCSCELTGFASEQDAWKRWNSRPSAPETKDQPQGPSQIDILQRQNERLMEFLRSFIAGSESQDFRPWGRQLYQEIYSGTTETTPRPKCEECKQEIDPDWCWCGDAIEDHKGMSHNHSPVMMGCTCGMRLPPLTQETPAQPERKWRGIVAHDPKECGPCDVELQGIEKQPARKASDERVCQCATYCMANAGMKWDPPVKCRGLTGTDPGAHVRFK